MRRPHPQTGRPAARRGACARLSAWAALAGATAAMLAGAPAAADWSSNLSLSQRFEADDNIRLEEVSDAAVRSVTSATLQTRYRTKQTTWNTSLGLSGVATVFENDGTADDRLNPSLSSNIAWQGKRTGLTGDISVRRRLASQAQFEEAGFTEVGSTQIDVSNAVGMSYRIDDRSTLRLGGTFDLRRFSGDTDIFTESETYGVSVGFNRAVTPRTRVSFGFGSRFFFADNDADTETEVYTLSAGVSHDVNPNLSLAANVGVDRDKSTRTTNGVRSSTTDLGFTGDASFSWRPNDESAVSFRLAQSLNPTAFGALQRTTSLSLSLSQQATEFIDLNLAVAATDRAGGGAGEGASSRQTFSISPTLSYRLTADWSASVGYQFRMSRLPDDTRVSNSVFLQVGRSFSLTP